MISSAQKFWATVSYLGPFVFIPLFFKIKGDFVSFHNRQALALFFSQAFFSLFSFSGIGLLISLFGWSFCFLIALIALISALFGQEWKIPVFNQLGRLFPSILFGDFKKMA